MPGNWVAKSLYLSLGFKETGRNEDGDEMDFLRSLIGGSSSGI